MVRGQNCTMSGKRQGISLRVGENLSLWKKSGKSDILRLRISSNIYNTLVHFTDVNHVVSVEVLFIKIWRQADVGFSRKSILYARYAEKLSIHVHCMWLAVRINKCVERMLLGSRGLSPLSGLICEIVNSAGQGNFTFVKKKSGRSQGTSETSGWGNHAFLLYRISNFLPFLIFSCSRLLISQWRRPWWM